MAAPSRIAPLDQNEKKGLSLFLIPGRDVFENLAVERELARAVRQGELIVCLWRNDRAVVIGRNQNAWRECRVDELEAAGGRVARRLSGGGAVYHDEGNLNVSFIAREGELDAERAVRALCAAVRSFGVDARATGRNDVCVGQAKAAGTASWAHDGSRCLHASLLVSVDEDALARWLTPSVGKLAAKGVASVRSRVANLSDLASGVTVDALAEAVARAAAEEFGAEAENFSPDRLDAGEIARMRDRFASREWRLGASRPFSHRMAQRFSWGAVDIELDVARGAVADAHVYSDAMDAELAPALAAALAGRPFSAAGLEAAAAEACTARPAWARYAADLRSFARAAFEPESEPKEDAS